MSEDISSSPEGTLSSVYTIPQTSSFLDKLSEFILSKYGANPIELTQLTLLLPTRRACRSMRDSLLKISGGQAAVLPRIRPIGEIDEDISLIFSGGMDDLDIFEIPPPVTDVERRLVLTKLVLKWMDVEREAALAEDDPLVPVPPRATPAQASMLAHELCGLMDESETEQIDLSGLSEIVPENYAHHWEKTLKFLQIITQIWPLHLEERGLVPPMERRNRLLLSEVKRLQNNPPKHPIIAAGATGSIPAAAELLKVVAGLPNGSIVLPGLDMELDDESWDAITPDHPEHPQFGMKKLLERIGVERSEISYLPGAEPEGADLARVKLVTETMRPAGMTHYWQSYLKEDGLSDKLAETLDDCALITAPSAQDEAEAVSLILRNAAETPGMTAALITPDRILGRRVSVRLLKWGLAVDDSAGRPLSKTVPGVFMDLVASVMSKRFAAAELMSLLKHPLTRLGIEAGKIRAAARSLEIIALRQPLAGQGIDAMRKTIERSRSDFEAGYQRHGIMRRMGERDWDRAADLLDKIEAAFEPLLTLANNDVTGSVKQFVEAHVKVAEALAVNHEGTSDALWAGEAGEALSLFLTDLYNDEIDGPEITVFDYPELYHSLISGKAMRPQTPVHPRLFIWGPLEARLQQPDIVILGGLNEGTWPQSIETDAWLSRPMRKTLGLPAPEQRTGLFAHDFAQLLGAKKLYMTRAAKVDGVPTVPSRWLLRLQTLLRGVGLDNVLDTKADEPWLAWARSRDLIEMRTPVAAPAPCPPVDKRPRQLSVTQIEDWIGNPYVIFARNIMRLEKMPELGAQPDASLRGQIIHQALHMFTQAYQSEFPDGASEKLVEYADQLLHHYADHPSVAAFWKPRFERFSEWFEKTEPARREKVLSMLTETKGEMEVKAPAGPFTLTARADRLDLGQDNAVLIYDYKTGYIPKDGEVLKLKSPQLPLEAAILLSGGFSGLTDVRLAGLGYISASGGDPAGVEHIVKVDDATELAREAYRKLKALVERYDKPETKYPALRRPQFDYRYDDYEHLSRVKEWGLGDVSDGDE
ncbi:MAG: double-strand break repair protein AddB [Methyloligellaceae bacterium]